MQQNGIDSAKNLVESMKFSERSWKGASDIIKEIMT